MSSSLPGVGSGGRCVDGRCHTHEDASTDEVIEVLPGDVQIIELSDRQDPVLTGSERRQDAGWPPSHAGPRSPVD